MVMRKFGEDQSKTLSEGPFFFKNFFYGCGHNSIPE